MSIWYRVFGREPAPSLKESLENALKRFGDGFLIKFIGNHDSSAEWHSFTLDYGKGSPLLMERYLANEEGIRTELNTWAGFLETCDYNPNHVSLMEHMIQTIELFNLRLPIDVSDEVLVAELCETVCQVIAQATNGVYQIDHVGFHSPEGTVLLQEY